MISQLGRKCFCLASVPLWVLAVAQMFSERRVNTVFSGTIKCKMELAMQQIETHPNVIARMDDLGPHCH